MYRIFIFFIFSLFGSLHAQEFQLEISVNYPQGTNAQKSALESLESELKDFMNGTKWTNMEVQENERIRGSLSINVKESSDDINFIAEIFINAVRPVYGSTYNTPILNYKDNNFQFTFENGVQPRNMQGGSFIDNLSAVMTSYAYLILGLDMASFSPEGGQMYFDILREIQNSIPVEYRNSQSSGWNSSGTAFNRNQFITELVDARYAKFHNAWYIYHLRGLDRMHEDVEKGKEGIESAIDILTVMLEEQSRSMLLQTFFDCKADELLEIFTEGDKEQRKEVFDKLVKLSPTNRAKFIRITRS